MALGRLRASGALDRRTAAAGLCALIVLSGCTVLPVADVDAIKQRASGAFDLDARIADVWPAKASREVAALAVPLTAVRGAAFDATATSRGHRAGDGSPPTFFVQGEGVVRAVNNVPRGSVVVDTPVGPTTLQIGPVVSGTAIRDAMPFIDFDDFPDQTSFAAFGMALTDRSLKALRPTIATLRTGDRVRFTGAASVADGAAPLVVTPVSLTMARR